MFAASLTTEAPPQMISFGKHPIALLIVIVIYILNHFIFRHEAQCIFTFGFFNLFANNFSKTLRAETILFFIHWHYLGKHTAPTIFSITTE